MTESTEPRALTAALAAPAFTTKAGTRAMHAAARHMERWAPEAGADRVRPLRNLGFVDRIIAPWLETAQRSPSLRMFSQYRAGQQPERSVGQASWLFPRPWYQDELDWMAASRLQTSQGEAADATTAPAMPQALYGYVAPSMASVSVPAYSPLVPIAAIRAADVAQQVAPAQRTSSGLRAVLHTMLQRASFSIEPTRLSSLAPELVTPPAPRAPLADAPQHETTATEIAVQRAQLAEVQRVALAVAAREAVARQAVAREAAAREPVVAREAAVRDIAVRPDPSAASPAAELDARIAQRIAERQQEVAATRAAQQSQRLHDVARESAARDARAEAIATAPPSPLSTVPARAVTEAPRIPVEIAQAIAALPPALASMITSAIEQQPERAAQAVSAFVDSLRTAEVLARTAAAGGSFESAAGPRIIMPAGLGGLVANMTSAERSQAATAAVPRVPRALAATEAAKPAALQHVAWADRWLARFAGANPRSLDVIASVSSDARPTALASLAAAAPASVFVAPGSPASAVGDAPADASPADAKPVAAADALASRPEITRFDDEAETPDEVFASIAAAARSARTRPTKPAPAPAPALPTGIERDTIADVLAHAAPAAPNAGLSAQLASSPFAPAFRHVLPLAAAPAFDVRALFSSGLAATYLAGFVASAPQVATGEQPAREAIGWEPSYVAPSELAAHTALLAPQVQLDLAAPGFAPSIARSMALAMALPMIGEVAAVTEPVGVVHAGGVTTPGASYAAPGMIADRAHAWSVAQERSVADLALDFVTPELVLAARVYGLGPAEAAQAARLALSGAGALSTMASTVDRTFVQALAIAAERRGTVEPVTAYPVEARASSSAQGVPAQRAPEAAASPVPPSARPLAPSTAVFGVERRMPRGAFMWPAATVASLGLTAASPDHAEQAMPVAALELLAARAVAELGSYAALGERPAVPTATDNNAASAAASAQAGTAAAFGDADALDTAVAMVPAARRAKLEAVFIALGQSSAARDWSPAARAARAFALAGRGDANLSARERAAIAWDVLPVVAPSDAPQPAEAARAAGSASTSRARGSVALPEYIESRPGLAALSARAGEALGSFVTPAVAAAPAAQPSREREVGAVLRAPTAAPEFVRPGRSAGRFGGGEVEIPAWFEAAARKMFEDKSGGGGPATELSLADLTLITSAPATQIAASSRSMPGSAPPAPSPSSEPPQDTSIDTESLAVDVYRQILALMDAARARNGEPYL